MDYKKSLEDIEKALTELQEENKNIPILVEGDKDIEALYKLNIKGTILSVNKGISLTNFCDNVAQDYKEIIILTDWDRKEKIQISSYYAIYKEVAKAFIIF